MHSNNNEESRKTLLHSYEKKYIFSSKSKNCFSRFVKEKREAIQTLVGTPITTRMLADHLGISYEMFRKIVNMEKPTKKRDCIGTRS